MKMLKKVVAITLATMIMGVLGACEPDYYPEYESGYYRYAVKTEKDGTQKAYILGLTESGLEQTVLIYPEEVDGIPVYGIGYELQLINGTEPVGEFYSMKLEKLYYPTMPKERIVGNLSFSHTGYSVLWVLGKEVVGGEGSIYGWNFYSSCVRQRTIRNNLCQIANVSYLYNYNENPNDGYYWVDSYNESVITFIPPEPQRDGFAFAGWYKEAECINKWDFSIDITGKEIVLDSNKTYDSYEGIYLYAKWVEK